MSNVWRIFVVEGEESLNRSIVNSLHKDGYQVQGVMNGADAVRVLWSEEYDVVICDLKTPGADGFELLEWLRAYRPNTRMVLLGGPGGDARAMRLQALESGAAGYLDKPLDLHLLKEELRRLLQQTGFSADLESFDLLDVIQIITMSHKSIVLLVNTGVEERGTLRFTNGDLTWAEYGVLRGEEAFFALAAHKNGTVTQQPWSEQSGSNVKLPLSRLIFQALQYRTKYANRQQYTGEQEVLAGSPPQNDEIDDRPFVFLDDAMVTSEAIEPAMPDYEQFAAHSKEWWEQTGSIPEVKNAAVTRNLASSAELEQALEEQALQRELVVPANGHKTLLGERVELPSWLTEQPTASDLAPIRANPVSSPNLPPMPAAPLTPTLSSSPDWQILREDNGTKNGTNKLQPEDSLDAETALALENGWQMQAMRQASPVWELSEQRDNGFRRSDELSPTRISQSGIQSEPLSPSESQPSQPMPTINVQRSPRRNYNYASLVAALQTLGYALPGFSAAAVMSLEGQPIAQIAVDELDLSQLGGYYARLLKEAMQGIKAEGEGSEFEDWVLNSSQKRTLLRIIGSEKNIFLVLITARTADLQVSQELMINVEGAISAALHS